MKAFDQGYQTKLKRLYVYTVISRLRSEPSSWLRIITLFPTIAKSEEVAF